MDSFTMITAFFTKSEEIASQQPINEESGGGSSNGYCVVARVEAETPVDEESGGGSSNGYCVVA